MTTLITLLVCLGFYPEQERTDRLMEVPGWENPPVVLTESQFNIPFKLSDEKKADIYEVRLHVSTDEGKTWRRKETIKIGRSKKDSFEFHAPADGKYWFALQVVGKDGTKEPKKMALGQAGLQIMQVIVRTDGKASPDDSSADPIKQQLTELGEKLDEAERRIVQLESDKQISLARSAQYDMQIAELRARLEKVEKRLAELEGGSKKQKK